MTNISTMNTKTLISVLLLSGTLGTTLTACSDTSEAKKVTVKSTATSSSDTSAITSLIKDDVKVGEGAEATEGQTVSVHYTGWLYDPAADDKHGKQFDSSRTRGTPFKFPLGAGRVIKGWDQGVAGMKVGGQRTLTIPSSMGYGARGAGGSIPPNATLIFDVELLGLE